MDEIIIIRRIKTWAWVGLCFLAALSAQAASGQAQPGGAGTIKEVAITGLQRVTEAYVQDVIRVRAGDPADAAVLDEAVRRLLRTGRFLDARYRLQEEEDGVRVVFELHERAILASISFTGNARFRDQPLLDTVALKVGDPVDWFAVRDGRDAIESMYRDAGYSDVVVTYDEEALRQTGDLVYRIEEGARVRIREIVFEGRTAFSERTLKKQIETKTAFWFFRTGAFDEDRVESDVARLQSFYRDEGFLDARVSYRREMIDAASGDLRVVFTIVEGTRYVIEDIKFTGLTDYSPEELLAVMQSRVGETVRQQYLNSDAQLIRSRLWELGYIYATVRPIRVFSETPGLVQVTMVIEAGDQFRVGRIAVRGNTRTKDKVVRRALNLYPPDDYLDLNETRAAEQRLLETRIFSSARVIPVGEEPGVRDIVIDVQEAEKSGDFIFGAGVTSNSGLVGTIVLDMQNFDLFDWPRSWSELFRFRSFFGAGQRLRLELQPGTEVNRFRVDFTEPYLFDRELRFDFSGYLFDRGRDGYNEGRGGMAVSVGKRFERGRLRGWTGELALRLERVTIDDVDVFAASDIRDDKGSHLLTSLKGTLVRDRTDSRFLPTTGDRLSLSYEQFGVLGGDHGFGRATARYQWYQTIRTDPRDRKSVLQLRAEGGAIIGDAPIYERFYAGGTGSIRGFQFRGVGPHEGIEDNNVGGDYLVLLGAEYSYPLYGENVRGHVFLDTGTVGSGSWRAAIGTGIRLTIDVLGPFPLEFNLAVPVSSDPDDEEQVFSFLIGRVF